MTSNCLHKQLKSKLENNIRIHNEFVRVGEIFWKKIGGNTKKISKALHFGRNDYVHKSRRGKRLVGSNTTENSLCLWETWIDSRCCWPLQGVRASSERWVWFWCNTGRKVGVPGHYPEKGNQGEQRLSKMSVRNNCRTSDLKPERRKPMWDVIIVLQ